LFLFYIYSNYFSIFTASKQIGVVGFVSPEKVVDLRGMQVSAPNFFVVSLAIEIPDFDYSLEVATGELGRIGRVGGESIDCIAVGVECIDERFAEHRLHL